MPLLLPQEIAEKLGPSEYVKLCGKVEKRYKQEFGVVSVKRVHGVVIIQIELKDLTRHSVRL